MNLASQVTRSIELAIDRLAPDACPLAIARSFIDDQARAVPLKRVRGHFEIIPISGGLFHDPWDFGAKNEKDLERDAARFRQADAVGVALKTGQRFLVDPGTRRLVRFAEFVDGSLR